MNTPKIGIISILVFTTLTIAFTIFPSFAIGQIEASKNIYNNVPNYKLDEAVQMWRIYYITIFQPLVIVFLVLTIISWASVAVYLVISYYKR